MREDMAYNEMALERSLTAQFGPVLNIKQIIVYQVPVGQLSEATLFLTDKKQLYLYVTGQSKLLLDDIKKIISRMGLKAELFLPPKGHPGYFNDISVEKFKEVFPGRREINEQDLIFYKRLVPYNPALVLISEVKDGRVYQHDSDSSTGWRVAAKFAYRRIRTS